MGLQSFAKKIGAEKNKAADRENKERIFKIYAPFTDCISEINST